MAEGDLSAIRRFGRQCRPHWGTSMLTCPHGHQWQPDGDSVNCPVCGSAPIAPTVAPPTLPDGATVPLTPSAPGPSRLPAIPGYEILGELGRGGMGVVYKAKDVRLGRLVALKMILGGSHAGPSETERFRTEAQAVARLHHPNVVQIYEVGEQGGLPFFSLEYVEGGSLEARLRGKPLTPADAARLVEALAGAMQAAHEAGIVHRDLKPGNVLLQRSAVSGQQSAEPLSADRCPLTADCSPKVTDFGLAKKLDEVSKTQTGSVMGTPSYIAPEQAEGRKDVGPLADVYALGAILYECLTGRPPFLAATTMDTLMQVISDDPAPPRQLNPAVPRDLEAVCLKCLQKDPRRRYASAADLAGDLCRFLAGELVQAQQSGLIDRLAGALDRVQLQASFASYGSLLLWLAPVMFLPEIWVSVVVANDWPPPLLALGQFGRAATFLLLVGWHRGWHLLPRGSSERQLWAVWGGYLAACFVMGLCGRLVPQSPNVTETRLEVFFYPPLAALTALAFFALAGNFWGYCAVLGAGFLALGFVMTLDLRLAPLEFGSAWAVVLLILGLRLRRLGREAAPPAPQPGEGKGGT
jgi:eukaryotic-like serine/threonine-protein kinase